jgi:hypothetical protein
MLPGNAEEKHPVEGAWEWGVGATDPGLKCTEGQREGSELVCMGPRDLLVMTSTPGYVPCFSCQLALLGAQCCIWHL